MSVQASVARVLLESSLPQLNRFFDYDIPLELAEFVKQGVRVKVPLGSSGRLMNAYVSDVVEQSDAYDGKRAQVKTVLSPIPVLTPEVCSLVQTLAERSAGNMYDLIRLGIPARVAGPEKLWEDIKARVEQYSFTPPAIEGYNVHTVEQGLESGERIALSVQKGVSCTTGEHWVGQWAFSLAQVAACVAAAQKSVIIAVPDYRDLDQVMAVLETYVPKELLVRLDLKSSRNERYGEFLRSLCGVRIIVGVRSVVYAPAQNLGLIIVWDDGDSLHEEPLSPGVHTRDAALARQQLQQCALVFASHVRSLPVHRFVSMGWMKEIDPLMRKPHRVVLSEHQQSKHDTAYYQHIPQGAWAIMRNALTEADKAGPVLVQVAHPGYVRILSCAECAERARCVDCQGSLGALTEGGLPVCSLCGALASTWECLACGAKTYQSFSRGSERIGQELGRAFPNVPVLLSDAEHIRMHVGAKAAIVVATRGAEPVAEKGYRAVVLWDAPTMLFSERLNVQHDCLRWWTNASTLAAADAPTILIGVSGTLAKTFALGTRTFLDTELQERATLRFPPMVRTASISGISDSVEKIYRSVDESLLLDTLGPVHYEEGQKRYILRFSYANGLHVAGQVRAAYVKLALDGSLRRGRKEQGKKSPSVRIRFDDGAAF